MLTLCQYLLEFLVNFLEYRYTGCNVVLNFLLLVKNIYNYQIEEINKSLIAGSDKTNFPIMSLEETLTNMKIIDNWLNF